MNNNTLDRQYTDLLQDILDNGVVKKDRTGTGTKSVFGRQIRHNMADGFPMLTTKKLPWKLIVTELMWFLRGDTNIKYLVDNNCHIWDGDCYKSYSKLWTERVPSPSSMGDQLKSPYEERLKWGKKISVWTGDHGNGMMTWEVQPFTQEEFIDKIKTDDEFANKWGDLGPIYGKQWRSWKGNVRNWREASGGIEFGYKTIDQIQNLINDLKTNPDSRRLMVNAWNVREIEQMVLPPCHYGFQVYTRELSQEERLNLYRSKITEPRFPGLITDEDMTEVGLPTRAISLMWNQRSVDTFLGLPFNIASYGLLLTIIAEIVNMVPDQLIGNLGDTHLYLNHLDQAKEQISREPFLLPNVSINTEFWMPGTEDGCGMGPGTYSADIDGLIKSFLIEDFILENYKAHPHIAAPLSN